MRGLGLKVPIRLNQGRAAKRETPGVASTRESRRSSAPSTALTEFEIRQASEGLGAQLKAMFDGVACEPLPDEIVHLVDALEGRARRPSRKPNH